MGSVQAQIQYTGRSAKWTFPNYYYTLVYTFGNPSVKVAIILIDTIRLCGNSMDEFSQHVVEFVFQDSNPAETPSDPVEPEQQFQWIEAELRKHSEFVTFPVSKHKNSFVISISSGNSYRDPFKLCRRCSFCIL